MLLISTTGSSARQENLSLSLPTVIIPRSFRFFCLAVSAVLHCLLPPAPENTHRVDWVAWVDLTHWVGMMLLLTHVSFSLLAELPCHLLTSYQPQDAVAVKHIRQ